MQWLTCDCFLNTGNPILQRNLVNEGPNESGSSQEVPVFSYIKKKQTKTQAESGSATRSTQ